MVNNEEGRAAFKNGDNYYFGLNGCEKDIEKAVPWYRTAAEYGIVQAQSYMGYFYKNGEGVPQDISSAIRWYKMAADNGDPEAQWTLHNMYANGDGVPQNPEEAYRYLKMAADCGDPDARFNIALRKYNDGDCTQDSLLQVIAVMEDLDKKNYTKASYWLGVKYYYGIHFSDLQNQIKSIEYLNHAKQQGHADAACILGEAYLSGTGVEQDVNKALECFYFAYDYGWDTTTVLYDLGKCFFEEIGTTQDCMLGSLLFSRYIETLDPDDKRIESIQNLLSLYQQKYGSEAFHRGIPSTANEILIKLNRAIQSNSTQSWESFFNWIDSVQGCAEKYAALGYFYGINGCPEKRDLHKSYACFRKSVCYNMQNSFSQKWLGCYYENGIAVEKDINRAYDAYVLSNQIKPSEWVKSRIKALTTKE